MIQRLLSALRGYETVEADPEAFSWQGSELTFRSDKDVPRGQKVRVTLPGGKEEFGYVSWRRAVSGPTGRPTVILGVSLTEDERLSTRTEPPEGFRAHQRHPVRQWVSFPKLKGVGCVTKDLSVEGCRLDIDLAARVGETHLLEIELPRSGRCITVLAKILWSREGETGLRFQNMHIQDEATLASSLGINTHPAKDSWDHVWKRSLDALTYRVTRRDDKIVILDFETPNWLATFEIEHWEIRGEWAGAFTEIVNLERSPQLTALRQELGLALDRPRSLIHLKLLQASGQTALAVWGVEHSFRRAPRLSPYGNPSRSRPRLHE